MGFVPGPDFSQTVNDRENVGLLAPNGSFTGLMQTLKAVYGSVIYGPQQSSPVGTAQPVARHGSAG
jgi:hypothetical protein